MSEDDDLRRDLDAAAFRRLLAHLAAHPEVQNIEMMNLAGFCRNCLANWRQEAAAGRGIPMTKDEARAEVYGMPYEDWRKLHQREASPEARASFAAREKPGS
ncbi:DUF1244 domain-containing protein [Neomegalonema sp.]|uniref:DUF1244 domain-containing protein n=1 Tax=Neomegalonema sp. TaxID=2039713 RepID=UPI00261E11E9|nr:DUF1244 domain-containing protein [Neomegalonema sp.]MDD2868947.1 DUF1244 domain-containing protein [Neomegalonema sp.]